MSARYEAVQMGPDDPHPGLWAIRDNQAGDWVKNDGDIERYAMKHSAEAWLAGMRYLQEFGRGAR